MNDVTLSFPPASQWCDLRCDRCPLSDVCSDGHRLLRTATPRGLMRVPPGVPPSDRVLPSGPPPNAPLPLARFRLERTGKLYVHALTRVAGELDVISPELVLYEIGEVARHEPGELRSAPNVLLLERMLDEAVRRLRGVRTSSMTVALLRSDVELRRAMAAWSNAVPEEIRVAIEMLVVSRRAPSPFCTTGRRRATEE